jgi:uncharacterized phosphosugar-binding protein
MNYIDRVQQLLSAINELERESMNKAVALISATIQKGGIVQLFGSGHSQLLAQESFYRAGGLVPVKPISIEPLMLHTGAVTSSQNEKDASRMDEYWAQIHLNQHDVLIVISTSGRNYVPVDIAKRAKEMGVTVITLQSLEYRNQQSNHQTGNRLEHYADVILNTRVPLGDGIIQSGSLQYGPVSTVVGATILNNIFAEVIHYLQQETEDAPVFGSSNVKGKGLSNDYWIEKYKNRINFH